MDGQTPVSRDRNHSILNKPDFSLYPSAPASTGSLQGHNVVLDPCTKETKRTEATARRYLRRAA